MSKQEEKERDIVAVEKVLSKKDLRKIGNGKEGQYIKLVNIEETKFILKELAKKYGKLEVTSENYKTAAKEAERELRETRYALQRTHKNNNSFINKVKKEEKELYEELIKIIKPQEERINEKIEEYKEEARKKREEKERLERERIEKIQKALSDSKLALEGAFVSGKTKEDLKKYDDFLESLKKSFDRFEEYEFEAQRIHALYTGKRNKLVEKIEENEAFEAKINKAKEQEAKVFEYRKKKLMKMGVKDIGEGAFVGNGVTVKEEDFKDLSEVGWYEFLEVVEAAIQKEQKEKEKEEEKKKEHTLDMWHKMLGIYTQLGGDIVPFLLPDMVLPSQNDIAALSKATRAKEQERKTKNLEEVKKEIEPYKNSVLEFLKEFEKDFEKGGFKFKQSAAIIKSFNERALKLVNTAFGEVYNK